MSPRPQASAGRSVRVPSEPRLPVALAGGVAGALLLLTTSPATFDDVVPRLVLGPPNSSRSTVLRRVRDRGSAHPRTRPVLLMAGVFAASLYGGYFGAAMGVVLLAVLGPALPVAVAHASGFCASLSMMVNGIAALVFLITADWPGRPWPWWRPAVSPAATPGPGWLWPCSPPPSGWRS
jgi:uncharacterized membrane protein YfcA